MKRFSCSLEQRTRSGSGRESCICRHSAIVLAFYCILLFFKLCDLGPNTAHQILCFKPRAPATIIARSLRLMGCTSNALATTPTCFPSSRRTPRLYTGDGRGGKKVYVCVCFVQLNFLRLVSLLLLLWVGRLSMTVVAHRALTTTLEIKPKPALQSLAEKKCVTDQLGKFSRGWLTRGSPKPGHCFNSPG